MFPIVSSEEASNNRKVDEQSEIEVRFQAQTSDNSKAVCRMWLSKFKFTRDEHFEMRFI